MLDFPNIIDNIYNVGKSFDFLLLLNGSPLVNSVNRFFYAAISNPKSDHFYL